MNREDALSQIGTDLIALIVSQAEQVGEAVVAELDEVALYASQRADHLALLLASGEPGFDEALVAERDNVVLKAALGAVTNADEFDSRILSVAAQGLRIAAMALAAV